MRFGKFGKTALAAAAIGVVATSAAACSSSGGSSKPVADLPSLPGGKATSVQLDKSFVAALTKLKVTPGVVGKATLDAKTGTVSFPITGGNVKIYNKGDVTPYVQGTIDHKGSGLSLTAGKTKVTLTNFVVHPGSNSNLTGTVSANGKVAVQSAKLFDLDGSTLKPITINKSTGVATLTGTTVLLSSDAAQLLDKTFKITALKGGLTIGIATLKVNSK